ncbi:ABC transporter ATP-binding protein [Segeticoccus rhizosphaerae]|uniref:ABC transporter ATP-binding protein n=1 Tax=Segeticoccus rhizosphaerae TaxID=1104777 RepID=UPI00126432D3|nr:ABC transporter ATP-binding protein [Segeticoccus rhizosphaerae]
MTTLLQGSRLGLAFGVNQVLDGVDVGIDRGELVAVMGPSGSGKSTLLHVLAGLLRPDAGQVVFDGQRIDSLSERARSRARLARMGFVFQFGDLIPELTLVENVELPLRLTGTSSRPARRAAMELLSRLEIEPVASRRVNEVSGGQAQRAAVARALVHRPEVIFADEPTGSLDTLAGELVLEALIAVAREQSTAVLLVTHEVRVAAYADRQVSLRDGHMSPSLTATR